MTPEDREFLAKSRWQMMQWLRFTGIIVMIIGMWIWAGDILRIGGWPMLGGPIFALGVFETLVLPVILAKKWKSQPDE